jgi:hypothetical protein
MGNQSSSAYIGNETTPATSKDLINPNEFKVQNTVQNMKNSIKSVLDFHLQLQKVYKDINSQIRDLRVSIGGENVIDKLTTKKSNAMNNAVNKPVDAKEVAYNKRLVQLLFNLGIFKTKIVDNETFTVVEHLNFSIIHSNFIKNMNTLLEIKPVEGKYSLNTVSEKSIQEQFQKNLDTMNNITARIMFFKYCIIFNNYLMHLYSIYAQSQFEVFKAKTEKNKKQTEFALVQKELESELIKTVPTYNVGLNSSINNLNKNTRMSGGSSPAVVGVMSSVNNVKLLLQKSFEEFNKSNADTAAFLKIVNDILIVKTKQIKQQLENTKNSIINENITKALKDLEKKIQENSITLSNSNIETLIGQLSNDEKEKDVLRNHLRMASIEANARGLNVALNTMPIELGSNSVYQNARNNFDLNSTPNGSTSNGNRSNVNTPNGNRSNVNTPNGNTSNGNRSNVNTSNGNRSNVNTPNGNRSNVNTPNGRAIG